MDLCGEHLLLLENIYDSLHRVLSPMEGHQALISRIFTGVQSHTHGWPQSPASKGQISTKAQGSQVNKNNLFKLDVQGEQWPPRSQGQRPLYNFTVHLPSLCNYHFAYRLTSKSSYSTEPWQEPQKAKTLPVFLLLSFLIKKPKKKKGFYRTYSRSVPFCIKCSLSFLLHEE